MHILPSQHEGTFEFCGSLRRVKLILNLVAR